MEEENWSSKYGEVVWAKFQGFPWWPSYIYDPDKLPTTAGKEVKDKAPKLVGKQYVIYFYADGTFGFVTSKQIRPFNEETAKQFSTGQKVGKRYEESFQKAVALAEEQVKLPVAERVSWHYSNSPDESEEDSAAEEEQSSTQSSAVATAKKPAKNAKSRKSNTSNELYFKDENPDVVATENEPVDEDGDGVSDEGKSSEEEPPSDEAEEESAPESDFEVVVFYSTHGDCCAYMPLCCLHFNVARVIIRGEAVPESAAEKEQGQPR
jgi:hypothetical protein